MPAGSLVHAKDFSECGGMGRADASTPHRSVGVGVLGCEAHELAKPVSARDARPSMRWNNAAIEAASEIFREYLGYVPRDSKGSSEFFSARVLAVVDPPVKRAPRFSKQNDLGQLLGEFLRPERS